MIKLRYSQFINSLKLCILTQLSKQNTQKIQESYQQYVVDL